jgi:hypothetical protein
MIVWTRRCKPRLFGFDIADYIKLDDPKLIALNKNVDQVGSGATITVAAVTKEAVVVGKSVNGASIVFSSLEINITHSNLLDTSFSCY